MEEYPQWIFHYLVRPQIREEAMNKKIVGTMIVTTMLLTAAPLVNVPFLQQGIGVTAQASESKVSATDQLEYDSITPM